MKATPPPDEKTVRGALMRVLSEHGLDPRDDWVSVRVVNPHWPRERTYTVVIAYHSARVALADMLRRNAESAKKNAVGVWVLDESQARELCNSVSNDAQEG